MNLCRPSASNPAFQAHRFSTLQSHDSCDRKKTMSTAENVEAALKEAERVCKRQKICADKTAQCIDKLAETLLVRLSETSDSKDHVVSGDAKDELSLQNAQDLLKDLTESTKDLHSAVNKLGKAVDKTFVQDICAAIRPVEFDQPTLNKVMAEHFYQQGNFRVGDIFVREAGIPNGDALKKPYIAMHSVLKEVLEHNLQPALHWTEAHKEELRASNGNAAVSSFEFRLHRLQFLHTLQTAGPSKALAYARAHFAGFQETEMGEIQRLMGCLCFVRRPGSSPYSDLMAPAQWNEAAREFARQCCGLLGQACESPLLVAVAAGSIALPTLLKLATVMAGQNQDFQTCTQLPVELELGSEFVFHSVFACPVSREQSTPENPPMLLPCGHVLCKQSLQKIAKSPVRSFKCPYCPVEATLNSCRAIFFPDAQ